MRIYASSRRAWKHSRYGKSVYGGTVSESIPGAYTTVSAATAYLENQSAGSTLSIALAIDRSLLTWVMSPRGSH